MPPPKQQKTTLTEKLGQATELFADLSTAPPRQPRRGASGPRVPGAPKSAAPSTVLSLNPCIGCPRSKQIKVPPQIPRTAKLIAIGTHPGSDEEKALEHFQGQHGRLLREELAGLGFGPADVGYAALTRCGLPEGERNPKEIQEAERHCAHFLARDIAQAPEAKLLLLGSRPLTAISGEALTVSAMRGLWVKSHAGRAAYSARHPMGVLMVKQEDVKRALVLEWRRDLKRMADRMLGRDKQRDLKIQIFSDPREPGAVSLLNRLAQHQHPWVFDIETYDAIEFPSRMHVSTDPCHEDFRVRGVAIAWSPTEGAWFELMGVEGQQDKVRPLLDLVFSSPAIKGAFNGGFDEEGLVYNNWVTEIHNRRWDGMLEMIGLSDGRHASLRLERAVVDLLGFPQYWNGTDKGTIRELPLEEVARAAVEDACAEWALSSVLQKRLAKGAYMEWKTWHQSE